MKNYNILSDNEIIHLIQDNNDQNAIDAFYRRHQKALLKSIKALARKIPYDLSFSPEELEDDAISESYLAIDDALRSYDFKSSNILSYINNKISWHFLDLQRNNSKKREYILSSFDPEKDEDNIQNYDYLEAEIDNEAFRREQHKAEILDAIEQARKALKKKPRYARLFEVLYQVFEADEEKPIPAAAKILNKSRQNVYDQIDEAAEELPQKLARDILDILRDNI